jgi:hypothetical protein
MALATIPFGEFLAYTLLVYSRSSSAQCQRRRSRNSCHPSVSGCIDEPGRATSDTDSRAAMRPCAALDADIYVGDHVSLARKNALLWDTMPQLPCAVRGTTCLLKILEVAVEGISSHPPILSEVRGRALEAIVEDLAQSKHCSEAPATVQYR